MAEWYEDQSFWELLYPFLFSEEFIQQAEEQSPKILQLISFEGDSILDLCCGPGRFSIPLAKRGYQVTGVDSTRFYIEKAKQYAQESGTTIEWIEKDMRAFLRPDSYDLIVNMFTSFGYFENKDDDLLVLKNMHTNLKPGGYCLIDVVGKEVLARIYQAVTYHSLPDGTQLFQRHEEFDGWSRMRNEWIYIHNDTIRRFNFFHTLYSGQELKEKFEHAGFQDVKLYGNFDGDEYGYNAERLIVVGKK